MKTLNFEQVLEIASALRSRRDSNLKQAELLASNGRLNQFWTKEAQEAEALAAFFDAVAERLTDPETNSVRITCKF